MKPEAIKRMFIDKAGKSFRYQKESYKFIRTEMNERLVKVITDIKTITIFLSDFQQNEFEWKDDCSDVIQIPEPYESQKDFPSVVLKNSNSLITNKGIQIADILMENISKVRSDKNYVPQAEAINNSVKAFIDLAKVEVEMIKATKI